METVLNAWKIPDPSEIARASPEDPEGISYTLAYDLRASLRRARPKSEDGNCPHRTVLKWRCMECGEFIANFHHFLDIGGHSLYFTVLDWKEIVLPDVACIYKGYSPSDATELREYMMLLLALSLNGSEGEKVKHLSPKLSTFLREKDLLWEQHAKKYTGQKILRFNSVFECGNLDRVAIINPTYYLLTVHPDVNTCGTSQWFYFSVSNTTAGSTVKFEIINFTKKTRLYRAGMRIWIFSKVAKAEKGVKWHKAGEEIEYKGNMHPRKGASSQDGTKERHFYSLSFKYTFAYDNDEVYFAYACPYPYSKVCKLISTTEEELEQRKFAEGTHILPHKSPNVLKSLPLEIERKHLVLKDILYQREFYAKTVCGVPSYAITITASPKAGILPMEKRKGIVITGRVHAGETSSSFTFEGFWNLLFSISFCPNSYKLGDSEISKLILGLYIIKVFPCLNPDGVIIGNSRTGVEGTDLNRVWQDPSPELHPVIHATLKMVEELRRQGDIEAFCDLHTHSDRCNSFIYGCPLPILQTFAAWTKTHLLPKMVAKLTALFSYKDCSFTIHPSKKNTARAVIWDKLKVSNCFTFESSAHGYHEKVTEGTIIDLISAEDPNNFDNVKEYELEDYVELGTKLGQAMSYFTKFQDSVEKIEKFTLCSPIKTIHRSPIKSIPKGALKKVPPPLHKRYASSVLRNDPNKIPMNLLPKNATNEAIQEKEVIQDILVEYNNNPNKDPHEESDASYDENILEVEDLKSLVHVASPQKVSNRGLVVKQGACDSVKKEGRKASSSKITRSSSQIPARDKNPQKTCRNYTHRSGLAEQQADYEFSKPGEISVCITNRKDRNRTKFESYCYKLDRQPHRTIISGSCDKLRNPEQNFTVEHPTSHPGKFELLPLLQSIKQRILLKDYVVRNIISRGGRRHYVDSKKFREIQKTEIEPDNSPDKRSALSIQSQRVQLFKRINSSFYCKDRNKARIGSKSILRHDG